MYAMPMGELFAQMRAYVDGKVAAAIARLVHFTYYSGNSADGTQDGVVCDQTDNSSGSYLVRRMQHFGFRSRPPKGVAAIRLGNYTAASNSVVVAEDSDRYGPGDLEDGEMAIYNKVNGTVIMLDKDGNINITAASGQNVVVNGGTADVARVGDHTTAHTHTATFALSTPAGGGTVSGTITLANANPTIAEGAPNFKA